MKTVTQYPPNSSMLTRRAGHCRSAREMMLAESHTNDNLDDFAMSGEATEDSTSDDESVIVSDVEVCSKVLDQHTHL